MIALLVQRYLTRPMVWLSLGLAVILVVAPDFGPFGLLPIVFGLERLYPDRASRLELALPIRGRDLFVARLSTALIVVTPPLAAWTIGGELHGRHLLSAWEKLAISALVVLSLLVSNLPWPRLAAPPRRMVTTIPWLVVAACGTALLHYLPTAAEAFIIVVTAALAAFTWTWLVVPESYVIAPSSKPANGAAARASAKSSGGRWWMPVLRMAVIPSALLFYVAILISAALGSALVVVLISLSGVTETARRRTAWLLALPVSPRQRLLLTLVPGPLALLACVAIGTTVETPWTHPRTLRSDSPRPANSYETTPTGAPLEYWQRSPTRAAPTLVAPWGERATADTLSILGALLYNPYSSDSTSSDRFVEWQYERLTTAAYGAPIARSVEQNAATRPPRVTGSPRMRVIAGSALLTFVLLITLLTEVGRPRRGRRQSRLAMAWVVSPSALAIVCMIVDGRYTHRGPIVMPLIKHGLLALSRALPSNFFVLVVLAVFPALITYALLERLFAQGELERGVATLAR